MMLAVFACVRQLAARISVWLTGIHSGQYPGFFDKYLSADPDFRMNID